MHWLWGVAYITHTSAASRLRRKGRIELAMHHAKVASDAMASGCNRLMPYIEGRFHFIEVCEEGGEMLLLCDDLANRDLALA